MKIRKKIEWKKVYKNKMIWNEKKENERSKLKKERFERKIKVQKQMKNRII